MIRIRFPGRGAHVIKTASRILGTAAFAPGYRVQDSASRCRTVLGYQDSHPLTAGAIAPPVPIESEEEP